MTYGFSTNITPLKGVNKQDWNSAQLMGLLQNAELQNSGCILFDEKDYIAMIMHSKRQSVQIQMDSKYINDYKIQPWGGAFS